MNNLNFLVDVVKESPVFKTLEKNVQPGRTVAFSTLSCDMSRAVSGSGDSASSAAVIRARLGRYIMAPG